MTGFPSTVPRQPLLPLPQSPLPILVNKVFYICLLRTICLSNPSVYVQFNTNRQFFQRFKPPVWWEGKQIKCRLGRPARWQKGLKRDNNFVYVTNNLTCVKPFLGSTWITLQHFIITDPAWGRSICPCFKRSMFKMIHG